MLDGNNRLPYPPSFTGFSNRKTCRLPYIQILRGHKNGRPNNVKKNISRRQLQFHFIHSSAKKRFTVICTQTHYIERWQLTKNLSIKMKIVMESGLVGTSGQLVDLKLLVWWVLFFQEFFRKYYNWLIGLFYVVGLAMALPYSKNHFK